jgi:hypothetical protein
MLPLSVRASMRIVHVDVRSLTACANQFESLHRHQGIGEPGGARRFRCGRTTRSLIRGSKEGGEIEHPEKCEKEGKHCEPECVQSTGTYQDSRNGC